MRGTIEVVKLELELRRRLDAIEAELARVRRLFNRLLDEAERG